MDTFTSLGLTALSANNSGMFSHWYAYPHNTLAYAGLCLLGFAGVNVTLATARKYADLALFKTLGKVAQALKPLV
ncbi:MAG: hypothetical protein VKJ06_05815 [Vampirovibrionales bacterium]|nr:hypothetical protein [Vampirovibrionales bacterium]